MSVTHAFVDESARGQKYYVCAAVVVAGEVAEARKLSRSFCVAGQRRWHFAQESPRRRSQILDGIVQFGNIKGWIGVGKGDEVEIRRRCMSKLATDLTELRGERLIIESREGRDDQDRRVLYEVLHSTAVVYEHFAAHEDPGLWLADALAWSYGAGGQWRERVRNLVDQVHDVGVA